MQYKTSIERILAVEQAMDVKGIRYKGHQLWPLIRMHMWRRLVQPHKFAPPATIGLRHLAQRLSQSFFKPDFYVPFLEHSKRHKSNLSRLASAGGVDIVVYSKGEDYQDKLKGKHYNRFLDPIVELARSKYTIQKIELVTDASNETQNRFEHTHFLDAEEFIRCDAQRSLINAFQQTDPAPVLEHGRTLTKLLADIRFDLAMTEEYIMVEAERFIHYTRYFKQLLRALKPKAVFLAGYQEEFSMALIAACKPLGITTVDVQRNAIGGYHGMYTHWMNMPTEGYNLLPDYFWSWSAVDARNLQEAFVKSKGTHRPVIGGNRWLGKWLEEESLMPGKSSKEYLSKLDPTQKRILVSLENKHDCLPDNLLEAIKQAPPEWHWWVRVYPGMENKIDEIASIFSDLKINNVEVLIPSKIPVYRLLDHVDWHVCSYSTVAVEALQFGVPSIITHATGRELYYRYIQEGALVYKEKPAAIVAQLMRRPLKVHNVDRYINTNRVFALDAMFEVVENTSQLVEA